METARAAAGGHATSRHARVEALLRDHRATLLWIARRWSGSAEDAEDALQRSLEIYVRRLDSIDAATEIGWMKVVVRHEAMALHRARTQGVPLDADDLAERIPTPDLPVQERIEREERNARSREAMARLKPDERTALLLKAEGPFAVSFAGFRTPHERWARGCSPEIVSSVFAGWVRNSRQPAT